LCRLDAASVRDRVGIGRPRAPAGATGDCGPPQWAAEGLDSTTYASVKSSSVEPLCVILRGWLHLKRLDEINAVLPRSHLEGIEVEAKCYLQICGVGFEQSPAYRGWCPFCNAQQADLRLVERKPRRPGASYRLHLPGKQYAEELQWGVDLEKTAGAKDHALPVPETQEPS
jgi:hypothetical protein